MDVAGIVGILGFALALGILVLTRYERRTQLAVEFFTDWGALFMEERGEGDENPVLVARVINTGSKHVIIDRDSFVFVGNGQPVKWYTSDFFGRETLPAPLVPGAKAEVGMYVEAFADCLNADRDHDRLVLGLELRDISGRKYNLSTDSELLLEVDEVRISHSP